jgi:hypothetical protein
MVAIVEDCMGEVDKRGKLEEGFFSYQLTKDGRVLLYWYEKLVKTLAGEEADKFRTRIEGLEGKEAQLVMAKFTCNFKRGNEH